MNTKTNPAVAEYLARTQAALADLPASEVEEIVEDIGPHLAEVAAELGENVTVDSLADRLGTPEQYAGELRAAAGYPPADPPPPGRSLRLKPRLALWLLVLSMIIAFITGLLATASREDVEGPALLACLPLLIALVLIFTGDPPLAAVAELPEVRAARRMIDGVPSRVAGHLRTLRIAWRVIRVLLLALGVLLALRRDAYIGYVLVPLVVLAILLLFSQRARVDARWRWVVAPGNAFAIGLGLALTSVALSFPFGGAYQSVNYMPPPNGLFSDGRFVDNVYVFGPDAKPLTGVYLYDQNGAPILIYPNGCGYGYEQPTNKVPGPRREFDNTGTCHEVVGVPFTVAIPTTSPSTTTTTPPATTTTPPPQTTTTPPEATTPTK